MRGRLHAVTADMLTAELRKRLAETNNTDDESPADRSSAHGCRLGTQALRLARVATAVHMSEVATQSARRPAAAPSSKGGSEGKP
jgi:hypothetical protein